jgi:23S rRNA (adenine2503-C2)-methyltransferase
VLFDHKIEPARDGRVKYRFKTDDGQFTVTAFFHLGAANVACRSTQIGRDIGCRLCATCHKKSYRNLAKDEIPAQAELIARSGLDGGVVDSVTRAGMGKSLANYENSMDALEEFRTLNPSANVPLSPVGLAGKIRRLVVEQRAKGLFVSLRAADDAAAWPARLEARGDPVCVRPSSGRELNAGCGQLAAEAGI